MSFSSESFAKASKLTGLDSVTQMRSDHYEQLKIETSRIAETIERYEAMWKVDPFPQLRQFAAQYPAPIGLTIPPQLKALTEAFRRDIDRLARMTPEQRRELIFGSARPPTKPPFR